MNHREYVGPVICEQLSKLLPLGNPLSKDWRLLPDGTYCLIGTEHVIAETESKPAPVAIDLGGDVLFILWRV